jgi:DMATS type aromatic prenyltransferase
MAAPLCPVFSSQLEVAMSPLYVKDTFSSLTKYLAYPNIDQYQWWHEKGPLLGKMLEYCHYSDREQYQYLTLFSQHLIPSLGTLREQQPGEKGSTLLAGAGSLELSLTFTSSNASLRIAFEPTSFLAGTTQDRYNKRPTRDLVGLLDKLEGVLLNADIFRVLENRLVVSDHDERILETDRHAEASKVFYKTQNILALELIDGFVQPEIYIYPQMKSIATEIDTKTMIFDAIMELDSQRRFITGLNILQSYLRTAPSSAGCMFLSHMLNESSPEVARVYISESSVTWNRVSDLWTLGGRLNDTKGLDIAKKLWDILEVEEGHVGANGFPLLFTMTLSRNKPFVVPKIGIPMGNRTEIAIAHACVQLFSDLGWKHHADSYISSLKAF